MKAAKQDQVQDDQDREEVGEDGENEDGVKKKTAAKIRKNNYIMQSKAYAFLIIHLQEYGFYTYLNISPPFNVFFIIHSQCARVCFISMAGILSSSFLSYFNITVNLK